MKRLYLILFCSLVPQLIIAGHINNSSEQNNQLKNTAPTRPIPSKAISRESQWDSVYNTGAGSYSSYGNHATEIPAATGPVSSAVNNVEFNYQPGTQPAASGTLESYGAYPYYTYYQDSSKGNNNNGYHNNRGPTYKYQYHVYPDPHYNNKEVKDFTKGWGSDLPYEYKEAKGYAKGYTKGWGSDSDKFKGWNQDYYDYNNEAWDYDDKGEKSGGGLAGLLGLAGLKGLVGVKALKGLTGLLPLLLLPLLLLPLLLPLLLFVPLPFIYYPPNTLATDYGVLKLGRSAETSLKFFESKVVKSIGKFGDIWKENFENRSGVSQCTERISCEVYKVAMKHNAGKLLDFALRKIFRTADHDETRGRKTENKHGGGNCSTFVCEPFSKLKRKLSASSSAPEH